MYFIRAVTKNFRSNIKQLLPGLDENPAYWSLFGYLAFGTNIDDKTNKLKLPYSTVAELAGKPSKFRNFIARDYLNAFIRDVFPFEYTFWSKVRKTPRLVKNLQWPEKLQNLIEEESFSKLTIQEKVYLHNGRKISKQQEKKIWKEEQSKANKFSTENLPKEEITLLKYMNNHPKRLFEKTKTNLLDASAEAINLEKDSQRQLNLLNNILVQSQPFYKPARRSVRIFPSGGNILCLKKELRKILTRDWMEMDLKSAQLAICTILMPLPKVKEFLENGGNIWTHLFDWLNVEKTPDNKWIIKKTLYSLIFGATRKTLKRTLSELGEEVYPKFMENPLIEELIKKRDSKFREIRKKKGATDCFGRFIPCKDNKDKRSVLSQLAQSYELKLIFPAVKYALGQQHRFRIALWQHDGFSVVVFDKTRIRNIQSTIEYLVKCEASELGIPTKLETTFNDDQKPLPACEETMRELGNNLR